MSSFILEQAILEFEAKDGNFSMEKMIKLVEENPFIRAIEVKLSQGAKPGKGGVLPGAKITQEIADIRGVEVGKDVLITSQSFCLFQRSRNARFY